MLYSTLTGPTSWQNIFSQFISLLKEKKKRPSDSFMKADHRKQTEYGVGAAEGQGGGWKSTQRKHKEGLPNAAMCMVAGIFFFFFFISPRISHQVV